MPVIRLQRCSNSEVGIRNSEDTNFPIPTSDFRFPKFTGKDPLSVLQSWLLNILYTTIVVIGWPWFLWRYFQGKNRRGWSQKLFGSVDLPPGVNPKGSQNPKNLIWIHAVSVGEVNLLGSILQEFANRAPEIKIAISTTTETGYDLAKSKYPESYVFFCPFDFTWAIKRVLRRLNPAALVLTELELWPNLIATADHLNVPVIVANGRLSEKSAQGYGRLSWLLKSSFKKLSLVLCQTNAYADRFVKLGCQPSDVLVTGNVKFDGIQTDRHNEATRALVQVSEIHPSARVFLAGSTQLEEDLIAAKAFQNLAPKHPELRLVLAPRHPQRVGDLVSQLGQLGIETQLRSELNPVSNPATAKSSPTDLDGTSVKPVLIIDVIGELGAWWGRADIAYVGGSMGSREGQNMIEPAAYGAPVSFGPRTKNFNDLVNELLANDAARVVRNQSELTSFVSQCLDNPEFAKSTGSRAQQVVLAHRGASAKTVDGILNLILPAQPSSKNAERKISDAA